MLELRLILLVAGAIIIVGVYLYSRRSIDARHEPTDGRASSRKVEPGFGSPDVDDELPDDLPPIHATDIDTDRDGGLAGDAASETAHSSTREAPSRDREEKIIVLTILPATPGDVFPGADLLDVFDRAGLEYGQFDVFHRVLETGDGPQSVFSVASATEPGSFDITTMADEQFRGLTLFMVLPGPMRGVDGFADMLATARRMAEQIRGEVTDRNRSTLTRQTAHHVREEIIAFEHRLKLES